MALSRLRSLRGLHIVDFDPDDIYVDPLVVSEMARLRHDGFELAFNLPPGPVAVFLNIDGLRLKAASVAADTLFQGAALVCFAEAKFAALPPSVLAPFAASYEAHLLPGPTARSGGMVLLSNRSNTWRSSLYRCAHLLSLLSLPPNESFCWLFLSSKTAFSGVLRFESAHAFFQARGH